MHGGGVHLKSGQFFDGVLGERVSLKTEDLANLHRSAFERLQFLTDSSGSILLKAVLAFGPLIFAKQKILRLVSEVTAGERQTQFSETEAASQRAGLNDFLYQSQPPFFRRCVASLRQRSSKASVCSLPGERSCSQYVTIAR